MGFRDLTGSRLQEGSEIKLIVTSTVDPAVNGAAEAEQVHPIHKIRTWNERYDPGGGGINAARVIGFGHLIRVAYISSATFIVLACRAL